MAQQLSDGNPAGVILGQSDDLVAFFGGTPTSQLTAGTAPASTAAVSISASQWGYSTSTQADAITSLLISLRSQMVSMGMLGS